MESITLTNPNKATFTFTLYHAIYCADSNKCNCSIETVLRSSAGGQYYAEVCNPVGVYLEHNEKRTFHINVLKIQQVGTAIKQGLLKVVSTTVKVQAETTKPTKKSLEK